MKWNLFLFLAMSLFPMQALSQVSPLVRIGYQPSSAVLLVGKAKGFYDRSFARDGARVEWDLFLSGPTMTEAAAGDRVDLLGVGNMPAITARAGGIDLKIIAKAAFNPATNAVLVTRDSSIRRIEDLKGKKVAAQIGSSVHFFLSQILSQAGLTLGDVQLVNLQGPDQGPALESGAVDAIVLWMPYRTQLEQSGRVRVIADSGKFPGSLSLYMVRNGFGKENPSLVEDFLRATEETNEYMRHHPKEALQLLSKGSQFPEAVLSESLKGFDWSLAPKAQDIQAMKDIKDFLLQQQILRRDFDIQDLFDGSYLSHMKGLAP